MVTRAEICPRARRDSSPGERSIAGGRGASPAPTSASLPSVRPGSPAHRRCPARAAPPPRRARSPSARRRCVRAASRAATRAECPARSPRRHRLCPLRMVHAPLPRVATCRTTSSPGLPRLLPATGIAAHRIPWACAPRPDGSGPDPILPGRYRCSFPAVPCVRPMPRGSPTTRGERGTSSGVHPRG